MHNLSESDIENSAIELFKELGYTHLSIEKIGNERNTSSEVVLKGQLENSIRKLNPTIPAEAREQALRQVLNLSAQDLTANNEAFHKMLTDGIAMEYQKKDKTDDDRVADGKVVGGKVWLFDFENPLNNDFVVCNQFTVTHDNNSKRVDLVLFVNGLPLVVIELKSPSGEKATVDKAFTQLQNYKKAIPTLFHYNCILVASDGFEARAGSLTAKINRFMQWKTVDGIKESSTTTPQYETLIKGMLRPDVLLDLARHFTVFEKTRTQDPETGLTQIETEKKIAAYHQYHAVNKAVKSTLKASETDGNRKAGVVWHTQGSGKSLEMVFYAGKIVLELDNPTVVIVTDRNDLDNQLFNTFASSKDLLRQDPIQAENRLHLKKLLNTTGGGVLFTTIQKFSPQELTENLGPLSERKNIIVIADEAHRSHYGFSAKTYTQEETAITRYGFAKYLRDALPNASFLGFTATPIEKEDASTPAVFGDYIDIYDVKQSIEDGATVPIYYESRLVHLQLQSEEREKLDAEIEAVREGEESFAIEKLAEYTRAEAIAGNPGRIKDIAADIVKHFEEQQKTFVGKGMIVAMSRRIAVALFNEIVELHPTWHDEDINKGEIKIVMTSSSSDPESWQPHATTKQDRKELAQRFKKPDDSLRLVIVCDMWLTGFDAPCLHTMYVDKPMVGHNLMQAIARVNRIYGDKPGGRIVDYIGIASKLQQAVSTYTESGGSGKPVFEQTDAIAAMLEKHEVVAQMFHGFDYQRFFSAKSNEKLTIVLDAEEHILGSGGRILESGGREIAEDLGDGNENKKARFMKETSLLSKAFALAVPSLQAQEITDEVGFFQAVKARLAKFDSTVSGVNSLEMETTIRQIIDKAIVVKGIVDVFDAAGLVKPDLSILSNEFLQEVEGMKRKNLALELLRKILNDEIRTRSKRNLIQSRELSELLAAAINKYQNNLLTTVEVIEELLAMAQNIMASDKHRADLGLNEDELAFYDALANNESAKEVLGDDILRKMAHLLVQKIKNNASIDWRIKESVRANLRLIIKKILKEYGYPPDKSEIAIDDVMGQAELFADEWSTDNDNEDGGEDDDEYEDV